MANVLIVDDDEWDLLLDRTILEKAGHKVYFAEDGQGALDVLRTNRIAVVVTDLIMPGIDGLALIRRIGETYPHIPVIAASGVSRDELELAEVLGAASTLPKPIDPRALVRAVDDALKRSPI